MVSLRKFLTREGLYLEELTQNDIRKFKFKILLLFIFYNILNEILTPDSLVK